MLDGTAIDPPIGKSDKPDGNSSAKRTAFKDRKKVRFQPGTDMCSCLRCEQCKTDANDDISCLCSLSEMLAKREVVKVRLV